MYWLSIYNLYLNIQKNLLYSQKTAQYNTRILLTYNHQTNFLIPYLILRSNRLHLKLDLNNSINFTLKQFFELNF